MNEAYRHDEKDMAFPPILQPFRPGKKLHPVDKRENFSRFILTKSTPRSSKNNALELISSLLLMGYREKKKTLSTWSLRHPSGSGSPSIHAFDGASSIANDSFLLRHQLHRVFARLPGEWSTFPNPQSKPNFLDPSARQPAAAPPTSPRARGFNRIRKWKWIWTS